MIVRELSKKIPRRKILYHVYRTTPFEPPVYSEFFTTKREALTAYRKEIKKSKDGNEAVFIDEFIFTGCRYSLHRTIKIFFIGTGGEVNNGF